MTSETPRPSLLFLHAHPDDECILTGATIAKASSLGIRSIVVYGTRGDAGETNDGLGTESLGERREREAIAACDALGVSKVAWLPYADSGMVGTATTANPLAFSNANIDDAARLVADLVRDEHVYGVVGYDANGTYGHPDHLQVHHLAHAVAPLLRSDWVFDATYCREHLAALPDSDGTLDESFAAALVDLTHFVTGEQWALAKLAAVSHHLSQIPSDWDTERPDIDGFRARFGTEWYIAARPSSFDTQGPDDLGVLAALFEPEADWPVTT